MKKAADSDVLDKYAERILAAAWRQRCQECRLPLLPEEVEVCTECIDLEANIQKKGGKKQ